MWLFLTSRLRQWLLFAVAVPILLFAVRRIRQTLEKRSGETRLTGALRTGRGRRSAPSQPQPVLTDALSSAGPDSPRRPPNSTPRRHPNSTPCASGS